jgi:Ca-activated chloride channel family protein
MRRYWQDIFISILACILLSGCSGIGGKLKLVEGNFFASRQLYDEAIKSYTSARVYTETKPYADYALGAVYLAMDENSQALACFAQAEAALRPAKTERELVYRIRYNQGIAYFQNGSYQDSSASFKRALEIDASRLEAKRNLELALLSQRRQDDAQKRRAALESNQEEKRGNDILFNFIRQKENDAWKNQEFYSDEETIGPDH